MTMNYNNFGPNPKIYIGKVKNFGNPAEGLENGNSASSHKIYINRPLNFN